MTAPAQVTFTTSVFTSPEFIGGVATLIALAAGHYGVHVFDNELAQQYLVMVLGVVFTGVAHFLVPGASGKLGITAPPAWSVPSPQDVPAGSSVIAVPAPKDAQQATAILPLPPGAHRVEVTAPPPVVPPVLPASVTVAPL